MYNGNELYHYGTPRHSGRYPWGSGDSKYQKHMKFLNEYRELSNKGMEESEIAKHFGITTTVLRSKKSIACNAEKADRIRTVQKLANHGYSNAKICEITGFPESTVRGYLKATEKVSQNKVENTANDLKSMINSKGCIDISSGTELELGITATNLKTAAALLKEEGYLVTTVHVPQATMPGQFTNIQIAAKPGTEWKDVIKNPSMIKPVTDYSPSTGNNFWTPEFPKSIDSKRVFVKYTDENGKGGAEKDGLIELRRGVEDLSLGESKYAQVRIALDGKYYLKGMAVYSDNVPDGYDIIVNSKKKQGAPIFDPNDKDAGWAKAIKKNKDGTINEELPFGSLIKADGQYHYTDKNGKKQLGAINKIREEGDWDSWSKTLASQFLSKQDMRLINKQLNATFKERKEEYDEIMRLTNPTVKKKLLQEFADNCDSAAVELKAKAIPGQLTKVIIPFTSLKDGECYCPTYENGTHLCLVRYPHGGKFEIPEVVVNNNIREPKKTLGNAKDAIGINSNTAARLSGADFDGDTVIAIPTKRNGINIKTQPPLKGLEGFDPSAAYPGYPGMKKMTRTGLEMGKVTNLINDMTLKGADESELARAVRHSMVVIDAEKHGLNYKQSEIDNDIAGLKKKYQEGGGVSTLISRAKSPITIPERETVNREGKRSYNPDPETGEWLYKDTGKTHYDKKTGKEVLNTQTIAKMAYVKDARELSSGLPQEEAYADYANACKDLANKARKAALATPNIEVSKSAKDVYATEVASLNAKLEVAQKNAPKERQAQIYATTKSKKMIQDSPDLQLDTKEAKEEVKKIRQYALAEGRAKYGANKSSVQVDITPQEWAAIQNGAISSTKLTKILNNTDMDKVRQYATPKATSTLSAAKQSRIKSLAASGHSQAEIADLLGISASTVNKYL